MTAFAIDLFVFVVRNWQMVALGVGAVVFVGGIFFLRRR